MSAFHNGKIQYCLASGEVVPMSAPMVQKVNGEPIALDRIQWEEGQGKHPLLQLTQVAALLTKFTIATAMDVHRVQEDRSTGISIPHIRSGGFLACAASGSIQAFGECIAANTDGPIFVSWNGAAKNVLRNDGIRITRATIDGDQFFALLPKDTAILKFPSQRLVTFQLENGAMEHPITLLADFEPKSLVTKDAVTLLLEAKAKPTVRERELIHMGMRVGTYRGEPPTGIRFLPLAPG